MRYRFKGVELRTENAAKPHRQASKWLIHEISQVSSDSVALDYGCGKFRYTIPLSRRVKYVCAVDSLYQIDRKQQVANRRTTLRKYARAHMKNVAVYEIQSTGWRRMKFDFILCANVLSVIPRRALRVTVLCQLKRVLKPGGRILISTQFRNTHFKQWETNPNATWIRDGWFVNGVRGASFYAIIPPKKLYRLCCDAGLSMDRMGSRGETAFVSAKVSSPAFAKSRVHRYPPETDAFGGP